MTRPLNITYITHYFPPEVNAPAMRVSEFCSHWAKQGHNVTVLTGYPNHPNGIIPREYRNEYSRVETFSGCRVIRSWVYATPNKGFFRRVINYLSFMGSSVLLSARKSGHADVVIGTSPQMFVAVAAWIVSCFKRAKFVFEVRDLWPEEIVAVGAIKNKLIIGALERLEMFLYNRADKVVAVAQGTIDTLMKRGIPEHKLALIPNGVTVSRFENRNGAEIRNRFKINGHTLISYIGTHGMAHRLETVLDAAEALQSDERAQFLFVGDGAEKESLISDADSRGLKNVIFAPQVSASEAPDYYAASDICLAVMRRSSLFTRNIPSKLYEIMAAGKPTLLGANGESQRLIEKANAGEVFEPENGIELAERIRTMLDNPQKRIALGENGKRFVQSECQRHQLADKYLTLLSQLTDSTS